MKHELYRDAQALILEEKLLEVMDIKPLIVKLISNNFVSHACELATN